MAKFTSKHIIGTVVAIILIGVLGQIAINPLLDIDGTFNSTRVIDGTETTITGTNATIGAFGPILGIMAVVGILAMFLVRTKRSD